MIRTRSRMVNEIESRNLGEIAADLVLDRDGRGHQLEVVGPYAPNHVGERHLELQSEVDLADGRG